ncbi:ParA family protein (plasmid) [Sutcliffiella horikoshii]|uniref:AAA family ATPase n=1 Tax=Sutcliffiella horikoshii TaxID=79883 RepID=UPI001CBFC474|nr:ParA family protein [Sutcliffiella horikoshii]UAL49894.1 ParA family protein [Sutcliffiella horikoshii]
MAKEEWEGTTFVIQLISTDSSMKDVLAGIEKIDLVLQRDTLDIDLRYNAIFLDGATVSYKDIKYIREQNPVKPILYKLPLVTSQTVTKNIQAVCNAYNIQTLDEYLVGEQIADVVKKVLFEEEYTEGKRVITFSGTHSGAGVSTTTLNVAKALAERVTNKVVVLSLNPWDPADYFTEYRGKHLDDIKVDLKTRNLTEQKLLDSTFLIDGFHLLAGNRDVKLQRYYKPEEIHHLIKVAKQTFDVVLIDTGTHFDNACYAQAFMESEMKFLVTTQEPKGYRGYWPHIFHQLVQPMGAKAEDFMLIINQYESELSLISEKDLSEELDMFLLTSIPDEGTLGAQAISRKSLLYDIATRDYRNSISTIASSIVSRSKLNVREDFNASEGRKGFFGFFSNKKVAQP